MVIAFGMDHPPTKEATYAKLEWETLETELREERKKRMTIIT